MTRFNGIGYTFVLAGFLKIVTVGGLVISAPVDAARTAFGKASPYLMVPVGLGMCWVAKQVGIAAEYMCLSGAQVQQEQEVRGPATCCTQYGSWQWLVQRDSNVGSSKASLQRW